MSEPNWKGFANEIMELSAWEGPCDYVDGSDLQFIAEKHGLLKQVEMTVPCGDACACLDYCSPGEVVECYRHEWKKHV